MTIRPYYNAASWLFEAGRHASRADALIGHDAAAMAKAGGEAFRYLGMAAEDLGFAIAPAAAMAFIAKVRDCPAMLDPLATLQALQAEAAQILPVSA